MRLFADKKGELRLGRVSSTADIDCPGASYEAHVVSLVLAERVECGGGAALAHAELRRRVGWLERQRDRPVALGVDALDEDQDCDDPGIRRRSLAQDVEEAAQGHHVSSSRD